MTSWVNMCWVIGGLLSTGILRGLFNIQSEWGYKIPFALQWIWPIPIIVTTLLCPESPYVLAPNISCSSDANMKLGGGWFDMAASTKPSAPSRS